MRKLIYYEFIKLNKKKIFLFFLVSCLFINGLASAYMVCRINDDEYSMVELSTAYQKYEKKSLNSGDLEQEILRRQEKGIDESNRKEFRMLEYIYLRCVELEEYPEYLNMISEQAEKRAKSSLFSTMDTYTSKNLSKTAKVYEKLQESSVYADFDGGVLLVVENNITDFLLLIIMLLIIMQIFLSEREQGTWEMNKCMKLGHFEWATAKLITSFCFAIVIVLMFYGTNFLVALLSVGFGDVSRAIQSVEGYMSSPFSITVRQYLVLFLLMKMVVMIAISCGLCAICMMVKNSVFAGAVGVLVYGTEVALTCMKSETWHWKMLREFNIATLNNVKGYFSDYYNMNLLSYPVSHVTCGITLTLILIFSGGLLTLWMMENEQAIKRKVKTVSRGYKEKTRSRKNQNLFFFEWHKIYVIYRGWIILLLFICVQIFVFTNRLWFIDVNEYYYREYSNQLEGVLSEKQEEFMQSEIQKFESVDEKEQLIEEEYENGEIDWAQREYYLEKLMETSARESAFQRVKEQYEELKNCQKKGIDVEYIYRTPWKLLFGKEGTMRAIAYMSEIFLALILLISSCGAMEKEGMELLIKTTAVGHKSVLQHKKYICVGTAVMLVACVYLPEIISVCNTFGMHNWSSPASSLLYQEGIGQMMTLRGYMIFRMVIRLFFAISAALVILNISQKMQDRIKTILAGVAIFIIPTLFIVGMYMFID